MIHIYIISSKESLIAVIILHIVTHNAASFWSDTEKSSIHCDFDGHYHKSLSSTAHPFLFFCLPSVLTLANSGRGGRCCVANAQKSTGGPEKNAFYLV